MITVELELEVNGETKRFEASRSDSLLDVLRDNGYTGAKRGCDTGACGFCTVLVDGDPDKSCVVPVAKADGATVETIEGLGSQEDLHPVQQAFVDNSALQCGFCIPGMIMRSTALLADNPDPTDAEIRTALSDNLCRCTGYKKIVEAVQDAADRMGRDRTPGSGTGPSGGDGTLAADGGRDLSAGECACGDGGDCA